MAESDAPFASSSLQSKDLEELLNTIDHLRSQGISHYVDLPQLIVCGDQSSGKSSVLEAVSGIRFPTKDNLCTRFATELILRRNTETNLTVTIVPGRNRSMQEKADLSGFNPSIADLDSFPSIVESAMDAMGLSGEKRAFSKDVLRVELSGPTQPHLTLVDLPGLFSASSKAQSDEDAILVKKLVLSYMKKTRSIILAIVSAKNDFANQVVTKHARDVDPAGDRTLGIITKPDTLYAGSETEKAYVELAENKDVNFRLGWHVLRNRDYDTRHSTAEERDQAEQAFFSYGIWSSLSRAKVGVHSLKPRLSSVLRDQILIELPSLIREVESGINDCESILTRLGSSRLTLQQQQLYLLSVGQGFYSLMKAAIDGIYKDPFFGDAKSDEGYNKRLRAVTQNTLLSFADDMRCKGHEQEIVDERVELRASAHPAQILRSKFIDEVSDQMKRSRGCELPGTFNPQIIGDLFYQQSRPWKKLTECCTSKLVEAARHAVITVLEHTADDSTSDKLLRQIINPSLDILTQSLRQRVSEILEPHQRGHPITYNHYFIESIQRSRDRRLKERFSEKMSSYFGSNSTVPRVSSSSLDLNALQEHLVQSTETNLEQFACSEAIDCMQAYYKASVARSNLGLARNESIERVTKRF